MIMMNYESTKMEIYTKQESCLFSELIPAHNCLSDKKSAHSVFSLKTTSVCMRRRVGVFGILFSSSVETISVSFSPFEKKDFKSNYFLFLYREVRLNAPSLPLLDDTAGLPITSHDLA